MGRQFFDNGTIYDLEIKDVAKELKMSEHDIINGVKKDDIPGIGLHRGGVFLPGGGGGLGPIAPLVFLFNRSQIDAYKKEREVQRVGKELAAKRAKIPKTTGERMAAMEKRLVELEA